MIENWNLEISRPIKNRLKDQLGINKVKSSKLWQLKKALKKKQSVYKRFRIRSNVIPLLSKLVRKGTNKK